MVQEFRCLIFKEEERKDKRKGGRKEGKKSEMVLEEEHSMG